MSERLKKLAEEYAEKQEELADQLQEAMESVGFVSVRGAYLAGCKLSYLAGYRQAIKDAGDLINPNHDEGADLISEIKALVD